MRRYRKVSKSPRPKEAIDLEVNSTKFKMFCFVFIFNNIHIHAIYNYLISEMSIV